MVMQNLIIISFLFLFFWLVMVIGYYIFSTLSKPLEIVLALYALLMGIFLVFGVLMLVTLTPLI